MTKRLIRFLPTTNLFRRNPYLNDHVTGGDAGLSRDVRDPRVEIALSREDPNRGLDDLLGLVWITHGKR